MICRHCGKNNKENSRFCLLCGKPMEAAAEKISENMIIVGETAEKIAEDIKTDGKKAEEAANSEYEEYTEEPSRFYYRSLGMRRIAAELNGFMERIRRPLVYSAAALAFVLLITMGIIIYPQLTSAEKSVGTQSIWNNNSIETPVINITSDSDSLVYVVDGESSEWNEENRDITDYNDSESGVIVDVNDLYSSQSVEISEQVLEVEEYDPADNLFEYYESGGAIYISEYIGSDKKVSVPSKIYNKTVKGIDSYAFYGSGITSVTIAGTVETIGKGAFMDCSSLQTVTLKSGLKTIGEGAFSGCEKLKSISMPDSVTSLGAEAFWGCSSLSSVKLSKKLTVIPDKAFFNCGSLSSVKLPEKLKTIGNYAFYCCSSLPSFSVPNSVESIGYYAFKLCTSMTSLKLGSGLYDIGESCFDSCYNLSSVTIAEGLTYIDSYAFQYCTSLRSISLPYSLAYLGYDALYTGSDIVVYACHEQDYYDYIGHYGLEWYAELG